MTPPQSVLKAQPGPKTAAAASASKPSGARAPVTPPKNPPPKPPAGLKPTPKSPPPKKDHAYGLSSCSYTEVEEERSSSHHSEPVGSRKASRSRTPLRRRPKGTKQRKKFAKQTEGASTSPKVTFAEPLEGGGSSAKGRETEGKGKAKSKGKGHKGKKGKHKGKGKGKGKQKSQKGPSAQAKGTGRPGDWS